MLSHFGFIASTWKAPLILLVTSCPLYMYVHFLFCFYQPSSVHSWTSAFLLAVHRSSGVIEGRLSHFLPRWLRTGWQSVISQGKIPWNTTPWLGIEPEPRGWQTVSYPTVLSRLVISLRSNNSICHLTTSSSNNLMKFIFHITTLKRSNFLILGASIPYPGIWRYQQFEGSWDVFAEKHCRYCRESVLLSPRS